MAWRSGGPPAFIGIGAHLSGTLWWRGLLARHPEITLRRARHWRRDTFFEPFCTRPMTDADVQRYHRRFRGRVAGEWSDRYLHHPWMLPLLARAAPDARLLVVLRDPVERFRVALGLRLAVQDPGARTVYMTEGFQRSRYAAQLQALHRFFGLERVLVLQYERCVRDPRGEFRRTAEFLGVDPGVVPRGIDEPPREPVPAPLWPDLEDALRTALAGDRAALPALIADLDLSLWP